MVTVDEADGRGLAGARLDAVVEGVTIGGFSVGPLVVEAVAEGRGAGWRVITGAGLGSAWTVGIG
ncbi:hypothetical protein GCM10027030_13240 [Luteococcus sediminum]